MIIDHIRSLDNYSSLIPHQLILNYINNEDYEKTKRQWVNLSPKVKVIRLDDFSKDDYFEFHKKFIDLHYTINGLDELLVAHSASVQLKDDFNEEFDFQLGRAVSFSSNKIATGFFAIILPGEYHRNRFINESTSKLVFKIEKNG